MLIHFIKFFHVLIALGLLSMTGYCLLQVDPKNQAKINQLNKALLLLSPFALITGTLLVHPKEYSFHTHWIIAAYLFLLIFSAMIAYLIHLKSTFSGKWRWRAVYLLLMGILLFIVHDAVTKTTFF